MSYPLKTKEKAIRLRNKGYSIKEIARILKITVSTSSTWLRDIQLSTKAQRRLQKRKVFGQYKARLTILEKRKALKAKLLEAANLSLSKVELSNDLSKVMCALLYWCEGNKKDTFVRFTNSDPTLIQLFLSLFRKGFKVDESKLRVLMHLHEYHNEKEQKDFWHRTTKIPVSQFNRTYLKPNTGKRKHHDYPGCVAVSYYDANIAKELMTIYNAFVQRGVG